MTQLGPSNTAASWIAKCCTQGLQRLSLHRQQTQRPRTEQDLANGVKVCLAEGVRVEDGHAAGRHLGGDEQRVLPISDGAQDVCGAGAASISRGDSRSTVTSVASRCDPVGERDISLSAERL